MIFVILKIILGHRGTFSLMSEKKVSPGASPGPRSFGNPETSTRKTLLPFTCQRTKPAAKRNTKPMAPMAGRKSMGRVWAVYLPIQWNSHKKQPPFMVGIDIPIPRDYVWERQTSPFQLELRFNEAPHICPHAFLVAWWLLSKPWQHFFQVLRELSQMLIGLWRTSYFSYKNKLKCKHWGS